MSYSNYTYPQFISSAVGNGALPQFPYDMSGVKYKTLSDILTLQRQWNTFDRIQNINFGAYLNILKGKQQNWYPFATNQEASDFRVGQQLHTNRYPNIPPIFFQQISLLPIPTTNSTTGPPRFSQAQPQINSPPPLTEGQKTENNQDMAIYRYVSSYNVMHSTFTYQFQSNEEQLAYYRALRRILSVPTPPPLISFSRGSNIVTQTIGQTTYYNILGSVLGYITFTVSRPIVATYFAVGGGGSAGGACGGGAGGLQTNSSSYVFNSQKGPPLTLLPNYTYTVVIGQGGNQSNGITPSNTILSGGISGEVIVTALAGANAGWTSWFPPPLSGGCGGGGGSSLGLQGGSCSGPNGAPIGNAGAGIGGNNVNYTTGGPGITYNGVTYGIGGNGNVPYNTIITLPPNTGSGGMGGGSLGNPGPPPFPPVGSGSSGIFILSFST